MTADRRHSTRIQAAFRVQYRTLDSLAVAYTTDLSRGGLFLRTESFLPVNAIVQICIELPEQGGEVLVIGRIASVVDAEAARAAGKSPGMGVQFLDVSGASARRIEQFVAERSQKRADESKPQLLTRRIRVVIADDDGASLEEVARPFLGRGDDVRTARDGLEALGACLKDPPDVLITDIEMPRMDGWQLLRVVRSRPSLASTSVLFVTSRIGREDRLRGYQLGVDDYVEKPFTAEELTARAERMVLQVDRNTRAQVSRRSLRGNLAQISPPSLLSFLEMERKTGVLLLVGEETVRLFLRQGRLLDIERAAAGEGGDPRALLFEVLGWDAGDFEFALQDVSCPDQFQATTTALLLQHAQHQDESNR